MDREGRAIAQESDEKSMVPAPEISKLPELCLWQEWGSVCQRIKDEMVSSHGRPRMIVIGPRNAGKSTLARAIVNHCIGSMQCKSVIYLETDVGQSELNPPGIIAAHLVREPLVGSLYAHNREVPISAQYYGATSPSFDPQRYFRVVSKVISDARAAASYHGCPIVANTHGWLSGIGLEIVQYIISQLDATSMFLFSSEKASEESILARLPHIKVSPVPHEAATPSLSSSRKRELNLTSYFTPSLIDCSSNDSPSLFRIHLRELQIQVIGETLPSECVMLALNGNIVGLCIVEDGWRCLGMGLVRAVCTDKNEIFVCSPIGNAIQKVAGIVLSAGLEVPQALLKAAGGIGKAPYLLKDSSTISGAIKARGTLLRRGLGE